MTLQDWERTKMNIEILSAKHGHQLAMIDGKKYEFNFTRYDLVGSIEFNKSLSQLIDESLLYFDNFSTFEMADIIADNWDYDDVKTLIKEEIEQESVILPDHLISE